MRTNGATRGAATSRVAEDSSRALDRAATRAAAGYSQQQILALLSRVPAFVVTNGKSEPYLTDRGPSGRSGTFYLAPRDALEVLQQIRAFDPAASLSIVPTLTL